MKLVTIGQSVAILGGLYSRESLRARLADGRLTGQRLGGPTGKWVVEQAELEKLLLPGNPARQ